MSDIPITNPLSDTTMNSGLGEMGKFGGLAKSARFFVRIDLPSWTRRITDGAAGTFPTPNPSKYTGFNRDLTYLCEAAEMPGRAFLSLDAHYYGPNQKLPFQSQYEDTTMTFLCRSESLERQFFDDWMENISPTNSFDFSFKSDYETSIHVSQYADYGADKAAKETYRITLLNAYPVSISPQPMTWADDQFQRLAVTFTYYKWQRINYDKAPSPRTDTLVNGKESIFTGGYRTQINYVK